MSRGRVEVELAGVISWTFMDVKSVSKLLQSKVPLKRGGSSRSPPIDVSNDDGLVGGLVIEFESRERRCETGV